MLVQNPTVPCLAVTGDYCPSSSTWSTHTHPLTHFFGLPVPIRIVLNPDRTLQSSHLSFLPTDPLSIETHSHCQVNLPSDCFSHGPTLVTTAMPRHSRFNDHPEVEQAPPVFTEPLGPVVTGCKRDASALSANCNMGPTTQTTTNLPLDSNDQCSIYLPPKPKESERMMHIQRWVNHLPWNLSNDGSNNRTRLPYGVVLPVRSHVDEDRELTPPPGQSYLTRLPFSTEEQQAMIRFFPAHSNHYRHHAAAVPLEQTHNRYQSFPPNHIAHSNQQQTSNHQNRQFSSSRRPSQEAGNGFPSTHRMQEFLPENDRKRPEDGNNNRLFAEWETRLISRLFKDFFHGNSKLSLPSLSEVRSRIASSRLKETRTATAVRSKIRRMQSSGAWLKYQ